MKYENIPLIKSTGHYISPYGGVFTSGGCRETFCKNHFKKSAKTVVCANTQEVFDLIRDIEKKLKLKSGQKIQFNILDRYDRKWFILNNLNTFWSIHPIRRRFLATAIKSAYTHKISTAQKFCDFGDKIGYLGNNFNLSKAIKRFLAGYTVIKKKYRGGFDLAFCGPMGEKILEKP